VYSNAPIDGDLYGSMTQRNSLLAVCILFAQQVRRRSAISGKCVTGN
jgi:hypothetical protein